MRDQVEMAEIHAKVMFRCLAEFIEFVEFQEKDNKIDGVCDPSITVSRATQILDLYYPEWREDRGFAEPA